MTIASTAPSIGANHPSARAFHAIHEAAQIAAWLCTSGRVYAADSDRIVELLAEAAGHVGAMQELLDRQERVIEEQRVETIREHRYATRVEEKNSELVQSVITLTRQLDDAHAVIQSIRDGASEDYARKTV